jgi:hypothetical protein
MESVILQSEKLYTIQFNPRKLENQEFWTEFPLEEQQKIIQNKAENMLQGMINKAKLEINAFANKMIKSNNQAKGNTALQNSKTSRSNKQKKNAVNAAKIKK